MRKATLLLAISLISIGCSAAFADPIKGGVDMTEHGTLNSGSEYSSYPAPTMVPQQPTMAPQQIRRPINGNIQQQQQRPPQRPIQAQVQQQVLPQGFLGRWSVNGQRQKVEAMPEFQAGAEQAFSMNTNNTWSINGNPGNYTMSNGEMSTQIWVDKVEGGTAFIRYQHQVKNTMAQEAIVMSLTANGASFNGLERISIVKEGLAQPRAKVTYALAGRRM
jgi:hypothetical protein